MADYKDPYTDPEKHVYDDNGIQPATSVQHGTHRRVSITDAVFGEINEDGPNYRAVCSAYHPVYNRLTPAGWLERHRRAHVEDSNWTWCSLYSSGLPQPWFSPWSDNHFSHLSHDELVQLYRWRLQIGTP